MPIKQSSIAMIANNSIILEINFFMELKNLHK